MIGVTKNVTEFPDMSNAVVAPRAFLLVLFFVGLGFCQPMHVYPLANFIEEVLVGFGVLLASALFFWQASKVRMSQWLVMWLALGGLFTFSTWLNPTAFVSPVLLTVSFWLVGLLALIIGDQLDWHGDGQRLARWLAIALLVTALLCAIGGFMRFYGLLGNLWRAYIPEPNTGRMTGLVGHSNFFAFISFFGLLSVGWLASARRLPVWLALASVIVLVTAMIATGSRAVLVAWLAAIVVLFVRRQVGNLQRWFWLMVAAFVFYWVFRPLYFAFDEWFYACVFEWGWVGGAGTSGSDVVARGAVSPQRLDEWKVAFAIFRDHLWTGVGIGNYAIESYRQHLEWKQFSADGLFGHSHNSPLQLAVELGIAGVVWVIVLLVLAARAFWRASVDHNRLLPLLVVLTIQIYGMFEFPMWMMHFLTLNMVLIGALGGPVREFNFKLGKLLALVTLFAAVMVATFYAPLMERFAWSYRQMFYRAEVDRSEYAFVDSMIRDPVLEPYGYLVYFANYNLSPGSLALERSAVDRLHGSMPYPQVLVRMALIYMIDGDEVRAQQALAELRLFYGMGYEGLLASQIAANWAAFPKVPFERLLVVPAKAE